MYTQYGLRRDYKRYQTRNRKHIDLLRSTVLKIAEARNYLAMESEHIFELISGCVARPEI
jgi:hypothetical protein